MLKWYAQIFKLTEKQLTPQALRRAKWLTWLSFPTFPLAATLIFGDVGDVGVLFLSLAFILSAACLLGLCSTKFVNRFWARDRYLDEWERAKKHQSMAFAFQTMGYVFAAVMFIGIFSKFFGFYGALTLPEFNVYGIGVVAGGLLVCQLYAVQLFLLLTVKPIDANENEAAL